MLKTLRFLLSFILPKKVEERKSEVSGRLEVIYANGKYMLDTANVNYSFGGLHAVFQKVFSNFNIKTRPVKNVLVLGFGAGSVAGILQDEYGKNVQIVGVERDQQVIELAKKYFSLARYQNLLLHCEDAYDFVKKCNDKFDLIVMDIFIDLAVPERFQEEDFLSALGKLLSPDGILFYNFIARGDKTRNQGGYLYKQMNRLIGPTEWVRLFAKSTENWVFVCQKQKL